MKKSELLAKIVELEAESAALKSRISNLERRMLDRPPEKMAPLKMPMEDAIAAKRYSGVSTVWAS